MTGHAHLYHPAWHWLRRLLLATVLVVALYALLAYLITPVLWRHYEHHPSLASAPKTTTTAEGFAGDPLNVGFVGTQDDLIRAFVAAKWQPADAITFRTSLGIVKSVLLHQPDPTAPVSPLFLWGRKQDLAFEQQVGSSARQRHHVRLWQAPELGIDGRPLWLGAVTFDTSVGLSRRTGQITHHIAPNIDQERDALLADVQGTGRVQSIPQVTGVGATLQGHNGGGDWYYTDGELSVAVLRVGTDTSATAPSQLSNPPAVAVKNRVWAWLRSWLPQ